MSMMAPGKKGASTTPNKAQQATNPPNDFEAA
jgi:hypothetical protein